MKQLLLIMGMIVLSFSLIQAQTQIENPGFEEWEPIDYGSIPEPVEWSSARTADPDELAQLAPAVWNRSEDAHSGMYSAYLINIEAFQIVATGTLTNGRIFASLVAEEGNVHTNPDDPRWNLAFTDRPDSIAGWYKANPTPGDFPTVKIVLHTGVATVPSEDSATWVAIAAVDLPSQKVDTWTRFSAPFQYLSEETPEFLLAVLTAGNALQSVDGSEAWFDDIELIYNNLSVDEREARKLSVNYAHGILQLALDQAGGEQCQLTITDMNGRRLHTESFGNGGVHRTAVQLNSGIYLVTVQTENIRLSKKLFVN